MGSINFYNWFSSFYPLVDVLLWPQKKYLVQELNKQPPGHLLELGVGTGSHLPLYKGHRITGIDTSEGMLKKVPAMEGLVLLNMDATAMDFKDNSFDYIVMSHLLAVVEDPDQLLREAKRVLKTQGKLFILNHFSPDNFLGELDRVVANMAGRIYLRSNFKVEDLPAFKQWHLLKDLNLGFGRYFKLLIFQKR